MCRTYDITIAALPLYSVIALRAQLSSAVKSNLLYQLLCGSVVSLVQLFMFFIAESIQSFSGIIFYAPKIGDISSISFNKKHAARRIEYIFDHLTFQDVTHPIVKILLLTMDEV